MLILSVLISVILISSCSTPGGPSVLSTVLVIVWNSSTDLDGAGNDTDIFFSRSTDRGANWSAVQLLNSNATSDGIFDYDFFPQAMTDGKDTWVVVWESNVDIDSAGTDNDIFFSRSTDDGVTWSAPKLLDSNATSGNGWDEHPAVMTDGNGTWVAVWRSSEDFNSAGVDNDIFFSRSTDNGATWSASQPLNSSNADDDARPVVMTDGKGIWVVAWFSKENLGGAGTDWDIFFSRSTNNGVDWSASDILNSNATTDISTDKDWRPVLMTDGDGNWVAAWNYYDNTTDIDIHFSRSINDGVTWSNQQALNSNAAADTGPGQWTGNDNRPMVFSLGEDIWLAVWQSREDLNGASTDSDIFFSRSTNDGLDWGASQVLNSNAATDTGEDMFGDED